MAEEQLIAISIVVMQLVTLFLSVYAAAAVYQLRQRQKVQKDCEDCQVADMYWWEIWSPMGSGYGYYRRKWAQNNSDASIHIENGENDEPVIIMRETIDGKETKVTYTPNQEDLFANDWCLR